MEHNDFVNSFSSPGQKYQPSTQESSNYVSEIDFTWTSGENLRNQSLNQSLNQNHDTIFSDAASEYGSEINSDDEQALRTLVDDVETLTLNLEVENEAENHVAAKIPKIVSETAWSSQLSEPRSSVVLDGQEESSHFHLAQKVYNVDMTVEREVEVLTKDETQMELDQDHSSIKSPLDRWRSYRPLAVSDFTSPAWCEVQYQYSLSKYGRIKRTPAMKRGSEVHRVLEEEVHEYRPVEVLTKEDTWGLRLWNVIQGLRTLRLTGLTRELDVWGIIDGQVVSGIIDELSIECPDQEFHYKLNKKPENDKSIASNDMTITEFFKKQSKSRESTKIQDHHPAQIYISDTKTRKTSTIPTGPSLKPIKIQLSLYHHLLSQLSSTPGVPSDAIFTQYRLEPSVDFSPTFIKSMSAIDSQMGSSSWPNSVSTELASNYNLKLLWNLMLKEFRETFTEGSISSILHANFRAQSDGSLIGGRSFILNENETYEFVIESLKWWRGQREARGVGIEETFKCRICEFVEGCGWRKMKEREIHDKFKCLQR